MVSDVWSILQLLAYKNLYVRVLCEICCLISLTWHVVLLVKVLSLLPKLAQEWYIENYLPHKRLRNGFSQESTSLHTFTKRFSVHSVSLSSFSLAFTPQQWSDELAMVAQGFANTCNFDNNGERVSQAPSFVTVGENILATAMSDPVNFTELVEEWFNEERNYDYCTNTCSSVCKDYTQVRDLYK